MRTWVGLGKFLLLAVFTTMSLSLTGCATIVKGRNQEVTVKTEPEGATIKVDGRVIGRTPMTIMLGKKSKQIMTLEKEGYRTEEFPLTTTMSGWFWGNILFGGLIGSTTDGITGAAIEYSPSQYFIPLSSTQPRNLLIDKRIEAKTFIIANYTEIINELHSTPGAYMQSLLRLLGVEDRDKAEATEQIKAMSETSEDIPAFADAVIEKFKK